MIDPFPKKNSKIQISCKWNSAYENSLFYVYFEPDITPFHPVNLNFRSVMLSEICIK